jgi:hypothetical protein
MYVSPNIKASSCNHCCSGKAIRFVYSECVLVALFYQACKVHAPRYIETCDMSGSTIFFHIISKKKRHDFWKENVLGHKMCVYIFPAILYETFLIIRIIKRDIIFFYFSTLQSVQRHSAIVFDRH